MGSALGVTSGIISGVAVSGTLAEVLAREEMERGKISCLLSSVCGATTGFIVGMGVDTTITVIQEDRKENHLFDE